MTDYLAVALTQSVTSIAVETEAQLKTFISELLRWNKKINLTAITDLKEISAKHIADSLLISCLIGKNSAVLDIGSGAGFPGIPLSIIRSDLEIVSVDAVAKKIQFQKHISRKLALDKFSPVHGRVEELDKKYHRAFDVVVSRAFASLDFYVQLAKPFVRQGGVIIAMKGPGAFEEIADAEKTLSDLKLTVAECKTYNLPFDSGERTVVLLREKQVI